MKKDRQGLEYLKQYPKLNKWINRCMCCGCTGYYPSLSEKFTKKERQGKFITAAANHLRRYFKPLKINKLGAC